MSNIAYNVHVNDDDEDDDDGDGDGDGDDDNLIISNIFYTSSLSSSSAIGVSDKTTVGTLFCPVEYTISNSGPEKVGGGLQKIIFRQTGRTMKDILGKRVRNKIKCTLDRTRKVRIKDTRLTQVVSKGLHTLDM